MVTTGERLRTCVLWSSTSLEQTVGLLQFLGIVKIAGDNVVLLCTSKYHDICTVINVSGCYKMDRGIEEKLGKNYLERIKRDGYIDVKTRAGDVQYRVTVESLMDRLNTNMHEACLLIDKECRVLTCHGSADEIIPVEDVSHFAKVIPNHKFRIFEGADHSYTSHQAVLTSAVLGFIKEGLAADQEYL